MIRVEVMRNEIFHKIKEENNERILEKIISFINEVRQPIVSMPPCCYTDEEKKIRIEQSVRDAKAGLGISQKKMIERHPEWI
jgi:hypothetical protein